MNFAYHNLGCKVNAYEMQAMISLLEEAGFQLVDFDDVADVYIINTCSVTNMADKKSRQIINRAKRRNESAIVVAVGCYIQALSQEEIEDLNLDLAIGNNRKEHIASDILDLLEKRQLLDPDRFIKESDIIDINEQGLSYENLNIHKIENYTRAFIKVQDGCNQFCSYCIIPYTRGRVRSRRLEDVISEIESLVASGVSEFVLTGIHVTSYNDTSDGRNIEFIDLIEAVSRVEGVSRIRLGSLEPRVVTKDFVSRLSKVEQICPHFHLSLQSGCDSVLERMNRKYNTSEYKAGCDILREYFDHPAITTDVIVGFPQETDEEHETTRAFLEDIHFYEMHVFKYSRRRGTRADKMPNQVDEQIKNVRSDDLLALDELMSDEFRDYYLGKELEVLIEEKTDIEGREYWVGYTKEYVRCAFESEDDLTNQLVGGKALKKIGKTLVIS